MFYDPEQSVSKDVAPVWKSFHMETKGLVNVAKVDCTQEKNKELCKEYKVKFYPTFIYFPIDGPLDGYSICRYNGAPVLNGFKKYTLEELWQSHLNNCEAIPEADSNINVKKTHDEL